MFQRSPEGPKAATDAAIEHDLHALRERLVAEGLHGTLLVEVMRAARQVALDPQRAASLRVALADPAALAERLRAVAPRPRSRWVTLGCFLLGVLLGPPLAYALLGNPYRSFPESVPRWAAAAVAGVLLVLLLAVVARYTHPAALGAAAGIGGGLAQMLVAALPWLAVASLQPGCTAAGACTVAPTVALGYALVVLGTFLVPLTLLLAALASLVAYAAQHARLAAAIRRA